jgi:hypothetical protein
MQNKILLNNINTKFKLTPFNFKENYVGNIKYFPADSKEWKNKVYFFNYNYLINLYLSDKNINKLIKSYFTMFFKNKVLLKKYISHRSKRLSLCKIYISRPEIKHTNSKAIITIYIFDKEYLVLGIKLKKTFFFLKKKLSFLIKITRQFKNFFNKQINLHSFKENVGYKYSIYNSYYKKIIKYMLHQELIFVRKYKLKLTLNRYKFKDIFLYKLSNLVSKFYNKKIEFNIINLQSIVLNPDIFTEIMKLKLRKKRQNVMKIINYVLKKVKLPKINTIIERGNIIKNLNNNLSKHKNPNIGSIIYHNNDLDNTLKELYNNIFSSRNIILNSIKYKNIGGIKLEVKGRLTWRYRADRSVYKVKWKGGLKNIDSSFKGLSTMNFRGYANSNIEYSILKGKRRIGAFAIKGWISGK